MSFIKVGENSHHPVESNLGEIGQDRLNQVHGQRPSGCRKLFFVTNTDGFGGTEIHLLELIKRLPRSDVQAFILQLGVEAYSDHLTEDHSLPVIIRSERFRNSLWNWFRFFRRNRLDIVVFLNGWVRSFPWYASLAAYLAGVPRCFSIHHLTAPRLARTEGWSLGSILRRWVGGGRRTRMKLSISALFFDTTICVSEAVRDRLVMDYGFPADKTITVHNGVSVSEFAPSETNRASVRTKLYLSSEEFLIVSVARLSEVKGLDILLLALAQVLRQGQSCKCIIVGDGPLRKSLVEQAEALGLQCHVFFEGFQKDVRPFLQVADAFVLTSYLEGLPLSIIEAMACGLPCVVTNVGGNAEAVRHMVHGLIVAPGSVEQTAEAILYMATHPKERAEMSRMAQSRVRDAFDVEARMAEIKRVILN